MASYDHKLIEKTIADLWSKNRIFDAKTSKQKYFSVIMPPPNVTGHLHLGHAWDGSMQDCIIRYKKLQGYNAIWIPGLDHAGIATQTKFQKILKDQNIDYKKMPNHLFLEKLKNWSNEQKQFIRNQWNELGFATANNLETYTMDRNVGDLVNDVFIKMYHDNLIYQDYKLVNWDIKLQTAISDVEAIKKPTKSKMYYFKYFLENSKNDFIPIATTRPETMFGDVAIFVNPNDQRYKKFHNKFVINPVNDKKLKIYSDKYIDKNFGTGAMKCTPAHDFNDYELAKKHHINEFNSVMNLDGTMNELSKTKDKNYANIDRLKVREMIVAELKKKNYLIKIEDHNNEVSYSERTNEIVEPLLSNQWFIKMKPIVDQLQTILKKYPTTFFQKRFLKNLQHWFKNINDWCISRQLLWGHRLPVYFEKDNLQKFIVSKNNPNDKKYIQSKDVLDTWFSSGLWPLICTKYSNNLIAKNLYPISLLTTAYDILFFWVARMFFQCSYFDHSNPFEKILIHGLIRDEQNRKMSKSLNNGIEPRTIIDKYGADALRTFLISSSTLGDDLRFNEQKIIYYYNFINKLVNLASFIEKNEINNSYKLSKNKNSSIFFINHFFLNKFKKALLDITKNMNQYNFVIANKKIIDFIWNDFANSYLELVKPIFYDSNHENYLDTINIFNYIFKNILIVLHPFMPFITDFLNQKLYKKHEFIWNLSWPKNSSKKVQTKLANEVIEIINLCKKFKQENNLTNHTHEIKVINKPDLNNKVIINFLKLHNIEIQDFNDSNNLKKNEFLLISKNVTLVYKTDSHNYELIIKKYQKAIEFYKAELKRSQAIVDNKMFIKKAPKDKVALEKEKLLNYQKKYDELLAFMKYLKN